MIKAITINNFKCFEQLRIGLAPLTLLTGFNSAGKSSVLQPLLLLSQCERFSSDQACALNGPLIRLGSAGDIFPSGTSITKFDFAICSSIGEVTWSFESRGVNRQIEKVEIAYDHKMNSESKLKIYIKELLNNLTYIGAIRNGFPDVFPLPDVLSKSELADVGVDGRFAPFWYSHLADNELNKDRLAPGESATSFRKQVDAWFSMLFNGARANVQSSLQYSTACLQFRLSETGEWRRPSNVGYGLSYAFPIIVALLAAKEKNQILIIDSPEAHLHPSAQSQMGKILARFAASGLQLIIETHSDHLLNGVRVAIKEGLLNSKSLAIHFFTGSKNYGNGVVSPVINQLGHLSDWPNGFFDQIDHDLGILVGWNE